MPLHEEAAEAIRALAQLRQNQHDRGICDPDLGQPVRSLFLRNGCLAHPDYLFADPLGQIRTQLGILNGEGKPALSTRTASGTPWAPSSQRRVPARRPS